MSNMYDPSRSVPDVLTPGTGSQGQIAGSDISRVIPRQISTGFMRGTQGVGGKGAKIDSSNNRIVLGATDGSTVGIGAIPGDTTGAVGFFATNPQGQLIMKIVNGTIFMLDPTEGNIVRLEIGLLPDGTYNLATSKPGQDLTTAFS